METRVAPSPGDEVWKKFVVVIDSLFVCAGPDNRNKRPITMHEEDELGRPIANPDLCFQPRPKAIGMSEDGAVPSGQADEEAARHEAPLDLCATPRKKDGLDGPPQQSGKVKDLGMWNLFYASKVHSKHVQLKDPEEGVESKDCCEVFWWFVKHLFVWLLLCWNIFVIYYVLNYIWSDSLVSKFFDSLFAFMSGA